MKFKTMNTLDDIIDLGRGRGVKYVVVVDSDMALGRYESRQFTGWPIAVLAIELPFLIGFDGSQTMTIDLRKFLVNRVSKKYAELMIDCAIEEGRMKVPEQAQAAEAKADDYPRCVRCGTRLVEKLSKDGFAKWCPECNKFGEKVPA